MNKAIFLDRDGIINHEHGDYTWLLEDFKINEGVFEALRYFQQKGYLLIIISNQSGIAKGLYTKAQVDYLHLHFERKLEKFGVKISEFYFCPHHPSVSRCLCRKPDSLLLEKAIARFNITPEHSWFIGDRERDAEAGQKIGVKTILVPSNTSLLTVIHQYFQ